MNSHIVQNCILTSMDKIAKDSKMEKLDANCVAGEIADMYQSYDTSESMGYIDQNEIPDFEIDRLAGTIIGTDDDAAGEACGFDNAEFKKSMLPALVKMLRNSTDRDAEIDFVNAFKKGVTTYLQDRMQDMMESELYS